MRGQAPFVLADGKEPGAFRTIGEVAQAFGLRQHVLRYWEEQFPMLKPLKRSGGRRYYRPEDVRLVSEISRLLYKEGFTIRGARQALTSRDPHAAEEVTPEESVTSPEPERPGEELERTTPPHLPDGGGEVGRKLRLLRSCLADALQQS